MRPFVCIALFSKDKKEMFSRLFTSLVVFLRVVCGFYFSPSVSQHRNGFRMELFAKQNLIVGLNKYSHDASVCIVDGDSGKILFAQAKERITGKKHDGGATGELLRYGLRAIDATVADVNLVVSNNHHHRVLPFEKRISFASAMKYVPDDYDDPLNLVPDAKHMELSHHLAHAWSVIGTSPIREDCLVVIMDGMGEQYKAMAEDMAGLGGGADGDDTYMHDLKLLRDLKPTNFIGAPTALSPGSTYREAESAYLFDGRVLTPVFKRWSRERSPSELYNHGFENMESLGAVYSRVSSHVLGDWNACGKIMGLASWAGKHRRDAQDWIFGSDRLEEVGLGDEFFHAHKLISGNPYEDGSFTIHWATLDELKEPNSFTPARFGELANLARSVQDDLEGSALRLVESLRETTGAKHLALAGGVALNSVLNGQLLREAGFDSVFIPPSPGDEGVAVGCALYGYHRCGGKGGKGPGGMQAPQEDANSLITRASFSPYQGKEFSDELVEDAILESSAWVEADAFETMEEASEAAAADLARGKVIAWCHGRSEFGQRALGQRSFLADPRKAGMRRFVNEHVKDREWWRPLAPSVLAEEAGDWFDGLSNHGNESPYMSITASVSAHRQSVVPSICHVDGTARLQTVTQEDSPLFHDLISRFKKKTGIPMVMNTSFNRKGQPIVESPEQAVATLLAAQGHVAALYIGRWKVTPRPCPLGSNVAKSGATEPEEEEGKYSVHAMRYYISEVTASPNIDAEPIRIRVQDGSQLDGQDPWRVLPSMLHLELLQLLQPQDESNFYRGDATRGYTPADEAEPLEEITVQELWDAMKEVRPGCDWTAVRGALQWLYTSRLVYFTSATFGVDANPSEIFKGVNIVDLRS